MNCLFVHDKDRVKRREWKGGGGDGQDKCCSEIHNGDNAKIVFLYEVGKKVFRSWLQKAVSFEKSFEKSNLLKNHYHTVRKVQ